MRERTDGRKSWDLRGKAESRRDLEGGFSLERKRVSV